jgi:nitroreductase
MELRDALRGTGSVRAFTDTPVDLATVRAVLDDARFAPSGGNRQGWKVALVQDATLRRQLADLMQAVWDEYIEESLSGSKLAPFSALKDPVLWDGPAPHHGNPLLDEIASVPVVLAVAVDLGRVSMMDRDLDRKGVVGGGSVYPFCWSILLAARERGLGGVLTTFLSKREPEAAPLLGLPDGHALVATIFLGHPVHQPTKLKRLPVEAFATLDRFDGPALTDG